MQTLDNKMRFAFGRSPLSFGGRRLRTAADEGPLKVPSYIPAGHEVARRFVMATSGNGQRGTYDAKLRVDAPAGEITLVVFEPSAADGSPLHRVEIPLRLAPG